MIHMYKIRSTFSIYSFSSFPVHTFFYIGNSIFPELKQHFFKIDLPNFYFTMLWNTALSLERQGYFHMIKEAKLFLILIFKDQKHWFVPHCRTWGKMWTVREWGARGEEDSEMKELMMLGVSRRQNTHHSCLQLNLLRGIKVVMSVS